MNPIKYRAVLWDFDGVIFDSDKAVWQAANHLLTHHHLPPEPYEKFRHRSSNHFKWYVDRGVLLSEEEVRALFYQQYDPSWCGLVEGARDILKYLHLRNVQCGIVSAHYTDDILAKLTQFEISDYFSHVSGGAYHKQEALKNACAVLHVTCAETLFVGDMLSDVMDGRAAEVTTVLFAPDDSPHIVHAHHHITDLTQLKALIEI